MGTPTFAIPILEMLHQEHNVLLVVTQPDKAVGRKKTMTASPVKEKALSLGLPVFQPEKLKTDYQCILDLHPDLLVTAAYGQMLPNELLTQVKAINVHGSLLPKYRGGAPIQYALFDGLKETGITIMYMAYKMDAGDIIKQKSLLIFENDNYGSLSERLSLLGKDLLREVLHEMERNELSSFPQDESKVTYAYTLKPQDEHIHFHTTTDAILNKLRGLTPEPGATVTIKNTTLKFYRAQKSDIIDKEAVPGTILFAKKKLIIKTIDGAIEILEIQAPGKKIMSVKDFLNGQQLINEGDVFEERKYF